MRRPSCVLEFLARAAAAGGAARAVAAGTAVASTVAVVAVAAVAAGLLLVTPAAAQGRVWVPLDESLPGSPAQIVFEDAASNLTDSYFDVFIHGFWDETRVGPDGVTYHKLDVPGLRSLGIVGAPHLPVVRERLALATDAGAASLADVTTPSGVRSYSFHLWPEPVPEMTDRFLIPEQFTLDPAIYGSPGPYPVSQGIGAGRVLSFGSVPSSTIDAYPCRWFPGGDVFQIYPASRWHYVHGGAARSFGPITRDRARLCTPMMLNWNSVDSVMPIDAGSYQGEYLFLYPAAYASALKPLIAQKKWRGYTVTQIVTDTLGTVDCSRVKDVIRAWCQSTPAEHDHYCLLAGGIGVIPFCNTGTTMAPVWTDDLYSTLNDNTLDHDVFVGRLAAVDAVDLSRQVTKILAYEDHPLAAPIYYGDVLLVAHRSGYDAAHDTVRTHSYAVPPNFFPYYGSNGSSTNAGLTARINAGFGITCYRGHGGATEWWQWDRTSSCGGGLGECYTSANVDALSNGAMTTVVWSIACNNADLFDANCIARHWMSRFPGGAVSHYAATMASNSAPNDWLEFGLFDAVWNLGITNQAHAIAYGEDQMVAYDVQNGGLNAYLYLLLGDPDMNIRRTSQPSWTLAYPVSVPVSSGGSDLGVSVADATGAPVRGALVSLWKPAAAGSGAARGGPVALSPGGDEVAVNAYSGADGSAHFVVAPQTTGFIYLAVRDSAGNSAVDSITVGPTTGVGESRPEPASLRAVPSVTHGTTRWVFGTPVRDPATLEIFGAGGRRVASLRVPAGAAAIEWRAADEAGRSLPSGIYFARVRSGSWDAQARVVVVR